MPVPWLAYTTPKGSKYHYDPNCPVLSGTSIDELDTTRAPRQSPWSPCDICGDLFDLPSWNPVLARLHEDARRKNYEMMCSLTGSYHQSSRRPYDPNLD